MGYLEKNFILHERDENGNILPIDYVCPELGGQTIRVRPTTRGRILRLAFDLNAKKTDETDERIKLFADFASEHIINPETNQPLFTSDELLKTKQIRNKMDGEMKIYDAWDLFVSIIYKVSGVDIETTNRVDAINRTEEELKKKVTP